MHFLPVVLAFASSESALTPKQQQVPLEIDSADPKLAKTVLLVRSVSSKLAFGLTRPVPLAAEDIAKNRNVKTKVAVQAAAPQQ
jgi:hypothetical protein